MDPEDTSCHDDYNYRERSNTWPSIQQGVKIGGSLEQLHHQQQFSPSSQCSSRLSYILESNESLNDPSLTGDAETVNSSHTVVTSTTCPPAAGNNFQQGRRSSPSVPNYKAGHPSYVELITSAILSSPEKRMTLSEIYDWMVTNVSAFKDQRHLHSSAGWKNSVRHNLSLHSRFKRVKRNGMDKPSWWTVDLTEQSKDRKQRTPKQVGGRTRANTTAGTMYRQSPKARAAANQQNWTTGDNTATATNVGLESAMVGQGNATGGHYAMADPFIPQVTTLNQGDAASGGSTEFMMYNYKDDSPGSCSPPRLSHSLSSAPEESDRFYTDDSAFASNTSLEAMEIGSDMSSMNLHRFAQAITVTLRDQTAGGGGVSKLEPVSSSCITTTTNNNVVCGTKPDIALQITGDMTGVALKHATYIQKQLTVPSVLSKFLKPSSAEDSRQMLRVQTNVGSVQDVAVPAPLPIRVVIHTDKQIQTDDLLENALEYSLQIRSPDPCRSSVSPMISADVGGVGSPYVNTAGVQRRVMPECAAIDADASSSSSTSTIFANSSWPWFNESSSGGAIWNGYYDYQFAPQ